MNLKEIEQAIESARKDYTECFNSDGECIKENGEMLQLSEVLQGLERQQLKILKDNELMKVDGKEYGLTQDRVNSLLIPFLPMAEQYTSYIEEIEIIKNTKEITPEIEARAKRARLDIGKIRVATGKIKDRDKKIYLQTGKVIQEGNNIITKVIKEQEEVLEKIEKHSENIEKERVMKLSIERQALLDPYEVFGTIGLGNMQEDIFNNFLAGCKTSFEQKQKEEADRIKKEKEDEAKRIEQIKKDAVKEYKKESEVKEVIKELPKTDNSKDMDKKRQEYKEYAESIDYDTFVKEGDKVIFYKKVGEFNI